MKKKKTNTAVNENLIQVTELKISGSKSNITAGSYELFSYMYQLIEELVLSYIYIGQCFQGLTKTHFS